MGTDGLGYYVDDSEIHATKKDRFCPYKKGHCSFCEASVVYDKYENCFNEDEPVCCYPKIPIIERILNNEIFNKPSGVNSMEDFCPVEMFDGFGMDGPKGRIEPHVILKFIKNNISDIFHYLKWYCDGKYTEREWRELQARILTLKIQED